MLFRDVGVEILFGTELNIILIDKKYPKSADCSSPSFLPNEGFSNRWNHTAFHFSLGFEVSG